MILASCTEKYAGPGAKAAHGVITFADGGIRFAFSSSSLVSLFRMLSSSARSRLRAVPALRAYIPSAALTEGPYTLQGLIAWKHILRTLETQCALPGSWEVARITKICNAHAARLLFRQVLLSVVGQLLAPHPRTNALNGPIRTPLNTSFKQADIPLIVITPPPSPLASVNTVPTPQDAAFGNQLTVPDPEFTVINTWLSPEKFSVDTCVAVDFVGTDAFFGFGGRPRTSWDDPVADSDIVKYVSWKESEEDVDALGLGPTWSG